VIRDILESKKDMAGYDVINRLELFIHAVIPDFELSIENPLTIKSYTQEYVGEIASDINKVADNLKQYCYRLTEMARKMEKEKDWNGNEIEPSSSIDYNIKRLSELKEQIDSYWKMYIDRKTK